MKRRFFWSVFLLFFLRLQIYKTVAAFFCQSASYVVKNYITFLHSRPFTSVFKVISDLIFIFLFSAFFAFNLHWFFFSFGRSFLHYRLLFRHLWQSLFYRDHNFFVLHCNWLENLFWQNNWPICLTKFEVFLDASSGPKNAVLKFL